MSKNRERSLGRCRLCGSDSKIIRTKIRAGIRRKVYQCPSCGLVFLEPRQGVTAFYRRNYRKKYGPTLGKGASPAEVYSTYLPFQCYRIEKIKHLLNKKVHLLDIGCSSGMFLSAVRSYVASVKGNDLNLADADFVRNELRIHVDTNPIQAAQFREHEFDLITCHQTLEHVEDPLAFLSAARRFLKPKGKLAVEVPNYDEWLIKLFDLPGHRNFYYREPHLYYYTPRTLSRLMLQAGFRGKIIGAGFCPNFINQFNWILCDRPQPHAGAVYGTPTLPYRQGVAEARRKVCDRFLAKLDSAYREFVQGELLSESMLFIGEKNEN
jgi:2-polyprenyl-3-methyl-5-hydroxy-6-metoxy-1,4-benzoquinol methylase